MDDHSSYLVFYQKNYEHSELQVVPSRALDSVVHDLSNTVIACERCGSFMAAARNVLGQLRLTHPETPDCSWHEPIKPISKTPVTPNLFLDARHPSFRKGTTTFLDELRRLGDDIPKIVSAPRNLGALVDCYNALTEPQRESYFFASLSHATSLRSMFLELNFRTNPKIGDRRIFHGTAKDACVQGDYLTVRMEDCRGVGDRLHVNSHVGDLPTTQVESLIDCILRPDSRLYALGDGESIYGYGSYVTTPSLCYLYVTSNPVT